MSDAQCSVVNEGFLSPSFQRIESCLGMTQHMPQILTMQYSEKHKQLTVRTETLEVRGGKTEKAYAFISFLLKIPQQKTLSKKEFLWLHSSRLQFITAARSGGDQSCCTSSKKQRAEDTCVQLAFSFLFRLGPKLREWCCSRLV